MVLLAPGLSSSVTKCLNNDVCRSQATTPKCFARRELP